MKQLIVKCDFIGFQPSLQVEEQQIFKSTFTGIVSILITIVSILCAGYFGSELFTKTTPTVLVTTEMLADMSPVNISASNYNMMFGFEDENYIYYHDPTVIEATGTFTTIENVKSSETGKVEQVVTIHPVKVDLCSKFYTEEDIL